MTRRAMNFPLEHAVGGLASKKWPEAEADVRVLSKPPTGAIYMTANGDGPPPMGIARCR